MNETNGAALPPAREAVVEQGQRVYQEVCHERDVLRRELSDAQTTIAGYKVALEAHASKDAMNESRMMELQIKTDNAVGRRAELETILQSILALLHTFLIGHEPLIRAGENASPE